MAEPLTPPFLIAALVLGVAGIAKLSSPAAATRALASLGMPARDVAVRVSAVLELGLCAWCLAAPSRAAAVALALVYALFAALALSLARRGSACGCFGERESPASGTQALLSAAFAIVALGAAFFPPHGLGWVLGRPALDPLVLLLGIAGAVYGTVLAYTDLAHAWTSWSAN